MSLLTFPEKVYTKRLKKKGGEIVESKLENGQCVFRPGRSTKNQIFALRQIFEKSRKFAKRMSSIALLILKRHMTGFLEINFGECSRSMAFMCIC